MEHKTHLFRIITSILCLCCALLCLYKIFDYSDKGNIKAITTFDKPELLYGNEYCFVSDEYIYTVNTHLGIIHIFDKAGEFKKGLQIPTSSGAVWCGNKDNFLYIYSVRNNILIQLDGINHSDETNIYYSSPYDFYNSLNLTNLSSKLSKNEITAKNNIKISLNIKHTIFSDIFYTIIFSICFIYILSLQLWWLLKNLNTIKIHR